MAKLTDKQIRRRLLESNRFMNLRTMQRSAEEDPNMPTVARSLGALTDRQRTNMKKLAANQSATNEIVGKQRSKKFGRPRRGG